MDDESSSEEPKSDELFQKLRDWQHQQHQRLIEQQQQQRLMLLNNQKQLLSRLNSPDSNSLSVSSGNDTPASPRVDDVLLIKPRCVRTFQQILENSLNKKEPPAEVADGKQSRKFPYLKRGQGISRFGAIPKPNKRIPPTKASKSTGKENKGSTSGNKCEKMAETEATTNSQLVPFQPLRDNNSDESSARDEREMNSSRTEEDLAVFELLERFATINASFSSSSSLIGQLIDQGVTHLPSPSKVMDFLSQKRATVVEDGNEEDTEQAPKLLKANKRVHFADSINNSISKEPTESECASPVQTYSSPFISNTLVSSNDEMNLDVTPLSPIGFPDFHQLFGRIPQSLWPKDMQPSSKDEHPTAKSEALSDPASTLNGRLLWNSYSNDFIQFVLI